MNTRPPLAVVIAAIFIVLANIAACSFACSVDSRDVGTADLTDEQRARLVRYGLTASKLAGRTTQQIVDHIVSRTSWDEPTVRAHLRRVRGSIDRDADSLVAEPVGVIVATVDAARVRTAIVAGLCSPLADEADVAALAACEARQTFTGMRLCRVSNGAHVGFGVIIPLTSWQSSRARQAVLDLTPAPTMAVVRDATIATFNAALTSFVPSLRRCGEGE